MKINQTNVSTDQAAATGQTQGRVTQKAGGRSFDANRPVERGDATDHISLSRLSQKLLSSALDNPAQAKRVEELASLHQSGAYRVDSETVSKKIVEDAFHAEQG